MTSQGGNQEKAGAVDLGGSAQAASAHSFTVGAVGFGPEWSAEDSMAASIIRLEQENQELRAEVALLREEQTILKQQLRAAEALGLALVKQMQEDK